MNAAHHLPRRNQGKPGELTLAIGVSAMLIAPFVLAIVSSEDERYAVLTEQGVVANATITGHESEEESYTDRKGRPKTRMHHYLELDYDANAVTSYPDYKASGQIAPSPYPANLSTKVEVGESIQEEHPIGARSPVVFVKGDVATLELVEQVETATSWTYHLWHYLAMGALFVAGLVMTRMGWRKRLRRGQTA